MFPSQCLRISKGDVGFDPLGFTENFQNLRYLQQAELKHARVAMLATVGFIATQYVHLPGDAYQNVMYDFHFVVKILVIDNYFSSF